MRNAQSTQVVLLENIRSPDFVSEPKQNRDLGDLLVLSLAKEIARGQSERSAGGVNVSLAELLECY